MIVEFKDPTQVSKYHAARIRSFKLNYKFAIIARVARERKIRMLVDIGCGTGPILRLAENDEQFSALVGCEPEIHLLNFARASLRRAELSSDTFDLLTLPEEPAVLVFNDVLHHVDDKTGLLSRLKRQFERYPSSVGVIFEPNCYNPITLLHQLKDDGVRISWSHVNNRMFRSAGLNYEVNYLCAGRDALFQSRLGKWLEGSLLSGVTCTLLRLPI